MDIIAHTEIERWNTIVKSFPEWDIYYLCEYAISLMLHNEGVPILLYYDDGELRITYVLMVSDIADFKPLSNLLEKNEYYDCETPYGYGGPLFDGRITECGLQNFCSELYEWAKSNNVVSQFIRFHPVLKNYQPIEREFNVINMKKTVCMDTSSTALICNNMDRKNRNIIRKAKKSGISIIHDKGENIDEFIKLYSETMDRNSADSYYYFGREYYDYLIQSMSNNLEVFYAVYDSSIIAGSIFFHNENQMHYHLSGSLSDYRNLGATNYLLYEAAKWAAKHHISSLHLGGGVGIEDSLYNFKKQFNKISNTDFCIGGNIFLPGVADYLVSLRSNNDQSFNPSKPYFIKYRSP